MPRARKRANDGAERDRVRRAARACTRRESIEARMRNGEPRAGSVVHDRRRQIVSDGGGAHLVPACTPRGLQHTRAIDSCERAMYRAFVSGWIDGARAPFAAWPRIDSPVARAIRVVRAPPGRELLRIRQSSEDALGRRGQFDGCLDIVAIVIAIVIAYVVLLDVRSCCELQSRCVVHDSGFSGGRSKVQSVLPSTCRLRFARLDGQNFW